MHKFLFEGHKLTVNQQRHLNPILKEVVKKEIMEWLDARIIFLIANSSWFSSCRKMGWRLCMDYMTRRKDYFPLPIIDQMLNRLARKGYYCFLDGYTG